jgi:hypothetical protein
VGRSDPPARDTRIRDIHVVGDPARLRAVAECMVGAHRAGHRLVTVLSAMGGTTNELDGIAYAMATRPQLPELDALLSVGAREHLLCARRTRRAPTWAYRSIARRATGGLGARAPRRPRRIHEAFRLGR